MLQKRPTSVRPEPVLTWVPVVDDHGHTHMEMRWHVAPESRTLAVPSARSAA
jgi:hypothetical protein